MPERTGPMINRYSPSMVFALASSVAVVLTVDVLDTTSGHTITALVAVLGALVARAVTR